MLRVLCKVLEFIEWIDEKLTREDIIEKIRNPGKIEVILVNKRGKIKKIFHAKDSSSFVFGNKNK